MRPYNWPRRCGPTMGLGDAARLLDGRRFASRQFALGWEAARSEESFPPTCLAEASIVSRQCMNLACSGLQHDFLVVDFSYNPVLVYFIRVELTPRGWIDILGARTRRLTVLFSRINDPIIGMERIAHRHCPLQRPFQANIEKRESPCHANQQSLRIAF
jgi:hypothetical protein